MRIALDDVTLEVHDTGAGSPVMLLHGWPDTADLWRHQVPALSVGHPAAFRAAGWGQREKSW
jgi:pimeloyl-ACP methyl ester carboxylesterase